MLLELGDVCFQLAGGQPLLGADRGRHAGGLAGHHGLLQIPHVRVPVGGAGLAGHEQTFHRERDETAVGDVVRAAVLRQARDLPSRLVENDGARPDHVVVAGGEPALADDVLELAGLDHVFARQLVVAHDPA